MDIIASINGIKALKNVNSYDEATTKQTIVLQIFHVLGWDIFGTQEVQPEFAIEGRRVDYCLRSRGKNLVFVEVKKPAEELGRHDEQLLDYAFKQGIKLAVLTNGTTWWFYLPLLGEKRHNRKFYTIDIPEQEAEGVASRFTELLSKENVISGKAVAAAEMIHQNKKKAETILHALPDAWNKMIGEPDPLMIELMLDTTEKICGFRPVPRDIVHFLAENRDQVLLEAFDGQEEVPAPIAQRQPEGVPTERVAPPRGRGTISVSLDDRLFRGSSIPTLYLSVLKHIVDNGTVNKATVPWGVGSRRYFIFRGSNPVHHNGKDFFQPVSYGEYHLEAHVNRSQGVKYLGNLCERLGYKFRINQM